MAELGVRAPSEHVRVIDIVGEITAASDDLLMDAYARASSDGVRAIVLDFTALEYMNSGGIGLLVTLLVRAQRNGQSVLGHGLSDHYRQIFELTRLDEVVSIHDTESDALTAAASGSRPNPIPASSPRGRSLAEPSNDLS